MEGNEWEIYDPACYTLDLALLCHLAKHGVSGFSLRTQHMLKRVNP
jgi:hypothetical protein